MALISPRISTISSCDALDPLEDAGDSRPCVGGEDPARSERGGTAGGSEKEKRPLRSPNGREMDGGSTGPTGGSLERADGEDAAVCWAADEESSGTSGGG